MSVNYHWLLCFQKDTENFSFPALPSLKELILNVGAWNDDSLLEFAYFIKSCPNLNRFALKVCI